MRKDMFKVVVERPRRDHRGVWARPGRTRALEDDDGVPLRARAPAGREDRTKSLNENLKPLVRYLERQVGRPWNKVYAEISAHLRPQSTVQQHVRDHLDDFVARVCHMQDGVVMAIGRWGGPRPISDDPRRFYVHPRTGLLRKNEGYRNFTARLRKARAESDALAAKRVRVIDEKTQAHLLNDGAWWEVKLARIGDGSQEDVVLRAGLSDLPPAALYLREGVRAHAKRQYAKAEKRKLGLP